MTKNVLILGGTGDIGSSVLHKYAQNETYHVFATYNKNDTTAQELSKLYKNVKFFPLNISGNSSEIEQQVVTIKEHIPTLDVLVSCIGMVKDKIYVFEDQDDFLQTFNTNFTNVTLVVKLLLGQMIYNSGAAIMFVSSVAYKKITYGQTAYVAAKSALDGYMRSLALELSKFKVTVNAVSPGYIQSRMVDALTQDVSDRIPLKRFGQPEEIADLIYFVTEKGSYITGQNIVLDGGLSL